MGRTLRDLVPSGSADAEADPRLVDVDEDAADAVFDALSSKTARRLYVLLREEPRPPVDIADELDTSVQNVHHHLAALRDADLVEGVDTVYSEKGVEMTVYAPADAPLVVTAADDEQRSLLRGALARLFGGVAVLAALSIAVQRARDALGGGSATPPGGAAGSTTGVPVAVLVFLGGLFVLCLGVALWAYRERGGRR